MHQARGVSHDSSHKSTMALGAEGQDGKIWWEARIYYFSGLQGLALVQACLRACCSFKARGIIPSFAGLVPYLSLPEEVQKP